MNRESLGRILLLIVIGLPGLCITWFLTHIIDQTFDQQARLDKLEAQQSELAYNVRIGRRITEGSVSSVSDMLMKHMITTTKDDSRNLLLLLDMQDALADVKTSTDAIRAKIEPPRRLFGQEADKP